MKAMESVAGTVRETSTYCSTETGSPSFRFFPPDDDPLSLLQSGKNLDGVRKHSDRW